MSTYIWPVPAGTSVNQPFGTNPGGVNPVGGHTGTDLGTEVGTPVRAPAAGVIEYAQWFTTDNGSDNPLLITRGGGISVVLNCGNNAPTFVFSHLNATSMNPGDRVKQGDIIAYSGNTGPWTTGPHLHFEAIPPGFNINSSTYGRVDPARYCTGYWTTTTTPQGNKPSPIKEDSLSDKQVDAIIAHINAVILGPYKWTDGTHATGVRGDIMAAVGGLPIKIWNQPVTRNGESIAVIQEVASGRTAAEAVKAENAALRSAISQLTEAQGAAIDYSKIEDAVNKALKDGTVTVDVNVGGTK